MTLITQILLISRILRWATLTVTQEVMSPPAHRKETWKTNQQTIGQPTNYSCLKLKWVISTYFKNTFLQFTFLNYMIQFLKLSLSLCNLCYTLIKSTFFMSIILVFSSFVQLMHITHVKRLGTKWQN